MSKLLRVDRRVSQRIHVWVVEIHEEEENEVGNVLVATDFDTIINLTSLFISFAIPFLVLFHISDTDCQPIPPIPHSSTIYSDSWRFMYCNVITLVIYGCRM